MTTNSKSPSKFKTELPQLRACVLRQELRVGVGVVLQLVRLDHDVGGGAEGAVDARRGGHDPRVRQREAAPLLPARQDHRRVAECLHGGCVQKLSACPVPAPRFSCRVLTLPCVCTPACLYGHRGSRCIQQ